nr:MAG TPA: hypothetical protein [Caudoviricetes sp.]
MRKKKTRNNPAPQKTKNPVPYPGQGSLPFFIYFLTSVLQSSMLRI